MSNKITVLKVKNDTDLYCQYGGQNNEQGCYVELDCAQATLSADYNPEIGNAVPFSVWHGHDQRWEIPCLRAGAANELLEDIRPLAERVVEGYESVWNGNNWVAEFDDDAQEAIKAIGELCDDNRRYEDAIVQAYDVDEWIQVWRTDENGATCQFGDHVETEIEGYGTITAKTTDDELEAMWNKIEADADLEGGIILLNPDEFLEEERDGCCEREE